MASNLRRLVPVFTSSIELNALSTPARAGTWRSMGSTPDQQQTESTAEEKVKDGKKEAAEVEGDEDRLNEGEFVNKETGEIGGPRGPEPTRYGDWEQKGDFVRKEPEMRTVADRSRTE